MPDLNFFVETSLNACTVKRIGLPLVALGESLARLRFYEDDELRRLAEVAGFDSANVVRRDLEPFARQVGVPLTTFRFVRDWVSRSYSPKKAE